MCWLQAESRSALADVAVTLVPESFKAPVHAIAIIGTIGGIALVNGRRHHARHALGPMQDHAETHPLAIFVIVGLAAFIARISSNRLRPTDRVWDAP